MTPIAENTKELMDLMRQVYHQERKANGKQVLDVQQMRQALAKLPREEDRDYELAVAGFARDWADWLIKKQEKDAPQPELYQLLPPPETPLAYGSDEEKVAFAAFAVAVNYERLHKNPVEEGALLEKYRPVFGKLLPGTAGEQHQHNFFFHLDLLYRMDKAVGNTDEFLRELLFAAQRNSRNLSENYGGHHAFAETVALVFENGSPALVKELTEDKAHWLEEAKTSAIKAIARDETYAKFYCTYGRVLALCGEIEEAIKNVDKAIAFEKSSRSDYSIRIGQYSGYLQQFRAQQKLQLQEQAMTEKVREMTLAMETMEKESLAKNMEFLGLFSGIVSFTIGSLTITGAIAEQSIWHAAGLIVVLLGALMCVFAAFGMILHGFHKVSRDKKTGRLERSFIYRHLIVFILGILVVAGGLVFCLH